MNSSSRQDRVFFVLNGVVSAGALALLTWLLVLNHGGLGSDVSVRALPPLNACLNGLAACLLISGRVAVKRGAHAAHRSLMIAAFASSALFLVGYLVYHAVHGDTHFGGEGVAKVVYLSLLASHVLLSIPVVPMALTAFYFAWRKDHPRHVKVTRVLHPIWLYVSITGVLVFLMLRPYYPA